MATEPLQPFHAPVGLNFTISTGAFEAWLLLAVLLFWGIYTLVACYHWVKYSHAASVAYPAITAHLFVSGGIALFTFSGLL